MERWIAGIVWLLMLAAGIRSLFKAPSQTTMADRILAVISPSSHVDESTRKKSSFGINTIILFIGIALISPILVPIDPLNQGDLETTRFLAPLSSAAVWEIHEHRNPAEQSNGFIQKSLERVNDYLLFRTVTFSAKDQAEPPPDASESYRVIFLFGTDALGRDVFSRVLSGARISLGIGIIVAALSMMIGMSIGFFSGIVGGLTDKIIMRIIDIFLSLPPLMLIIALFAVLGGSMKVLIIALAVSGWMGVARLVRGEVLRLREREFILSAKLLGVSSYGIVRHHIVPNILPAVVTASVLLLINAIMGEAALSFLGLGIQPPTASWGNMIGESLIYLGSAWWIGIFPGLALSIFAVAAQLVAEGIQESRQ